MHDIPELLELTKSIANSASKKLCELKKQGIQNFEFEDDLPREMKAEADKLVEEYILKKLAPTGLPILSEETGDIAGDLASSLRFIVDPLDGTVNFIRGLGNASVSIALYRENNPVFGVLGLYPTGDLIWGGKGFGAFFNDKAIYVSSTDNIAQSVLCTGFPSRFQFGDTEQSSVFFQAMSRFGKVRMLGAASISLLKVAEGAADLYLEHDIMLWDVAAGLAIVEGAGGRLSITSGEVPNALNVEASNGKITFYRN